jgi:hypothetical protein
MRGTHFGVSPPQAWTGTVAHRGGGFGLAVGMAARRARPWTRVSGRARTRRGEGGGGQRGGGFRHEHIIRSHAVTRECLPARPIGAQRCATLTMTSGPRVSAIFLIKNTPERK